MVFQAGFQGEIIANAVKSRESVPEVQMDFLIRWKSDLNHTADFGQFEIKSSAKGPSRGIQGDQWLYDNHVIPMLVLPLFKSANPSTPDVLTCVWKWLKYSLILVAPVALGLLALLVESAGFFGTLGTLKAAWADEGRLPSTESSSSKLRSERKQTQQQHKAVIQVNTLDSTTSRYGTFKQVGGKKSARHQ